MKDSSDKKLLISIMIATHNRAEILNRTLGSFCSLEIPEGIELEVIIVPNGSNDNTVEIIEKKRKALPFTLRVYVEEQANLNLARNRCLQEAGGEILVFVDDDVWIEPGWLKGMMEVYNSREADLVAGRVMLWWESDVPPIWTSTAVERLLSQLNFGDDIIPLNKAGQVVGANFSFRRAVMKQIGNFAPGLDRAGQGLLSGGDSDFVRRALWAGFKLFYAPNMTVKHWIPIHRTSIDYLSRLAKSRGITQVALAGKKGNLNRFSLLRGGLIQVLIGSAKEFFYGMIGRQKYAVAGRLLRMRGFGILHATFRAKT
jgi:glycosyltransferase involved in cell wall biosynthesis